MSLSVEDALSGAISCLEEANLCLIDAILEADVSEVIERLESIIDYLEKSLREIEETEDE